MIDWFDYHGHMCIAFEMLGLSVFDFLVSLLVSFLFFLKRKKMFFQSYHIKLFYLLFTYLARKQL